jgi:hypothetical protein
MCLLTERKTTCESSTIDTQYELMSSCVCVCVRPCPNQMCVHVMKQKKCHYIGNCSFAHSLEERDVWTYMKNNSCKPLASANQTCLCLTVDTRRCDILQAHQRDTTIMANAHFWLATESGQVMSLGLILCVTGYTITVYKFRGNQIHFPPVHLTRDKVVC